MSSSILMVASYSIVWLSSGTDLLSSLSIYSLSLAENELSPPIMNPPTKLPLLAALPKVLTMLP